MSESFNLRDMRVSIHPILIIEVTFHRYLLENRDLIYVLRFLNVRLVLFRYWLRIHVATAKVVHRVHFLLNFLSLLDFVDRLLHIALSLISPILST